MLYLYPAIFHKEEGSYWVEFPDPPGCQTFGDTLAETMEDAQEALAAYLVTLLSDGTPIPAPSPIQACIGISCVNYAFKSCFALNSHKGHVNSLLKWFGGDSKGWFLPFGKAYAIMIPAGH